MSSDPTENDRNWLEMLRRRDDPAWQRLWSAYFERLVRLAQRRLPANCGRAAGGEDLAISALRTFARRAAVGEFQKLTDGDELWVLLQRITLRKTLKWIQYERRQKRDVRRVNDEAALTAPGAEDEERAIEQELGKEPTPDCVAQSVDELDRLFRLLPDEKTREVARLRLEGCTLSEIVQRTGKSETTVKRKLKLIRSL